MLLGLASDATFTAYLLLRVYGEPVTLPTILSRDGPIEEKKKITVVFSDVAPEEWTT